MSSMARGYRGGFVQDRSVVVVAATRIVVVGNDGGGGRWQR